jgi:hypothetical protein
MDEPAAPVKSPRFPWVAALLCAASLGAAGWTWMRYSYAWPIAIADVYAPHSYENADGTWAGFLLEVRGLFVVTDDGCPLIMDARNLGGDEGVCIGVVLPASGPMPEHRREARLVGRIGYRPKDGFPSFLSLDTTASRFRGASITGLVVGAMGVFVFVMCLRTWVKERSALPRA